MFRYNDPGYTIGGPVYIPHVLERYRHKMFFFFSQEWQKQLSPNTAKNVLVPTALERKGDFSQSLNNNGAEAYFHQRPADPNAVPRHGGSGEPNLRARTGAAEYLPAAERRRRFRTSITRRSFQARRRGAKPSCGWTTT